MTSGHGKGLMGNYNVNGVYKKVPASNKITENNKLLILII